MIGTERLSELFVELADTLVADFDLVDFLHRVTDHVAEASGEPDVGLMLEDAGGGLRFMAAAGEAGVLELLQLEHDEGPCVDCHRTGVSVAHVDLAEAGDRWPTFAPRAVEAGFRSVHAFPMRLRDDVIGAMNVFGRQAGPLDEQDVAVIQALTHVATISIIQERIVDRVELVAAQLQHALDSRVVIEQAKGVVSQALGLDVHDAFTVIRSHARSHGLRLAAVAHDLVRDPSAVDRLVAAGR